MNKIFAAFDTPGGHMGVCLILIVMGWGMHLNGIPAQGDALITGAAAAIFFAMKGQNGAKVSIQPKPDERQDDTGK